MLGAEIGLLIARISSYGLRRWQQVNYIFKGLFQDFDSGDVVLPAYLVLHRLRRLRNHTSLISLY